MVTTTRTPAPAVSGRTHPASVLAQFISRPASRRPVVGRADRDRHQRVRRERREHEQRSARAELAMLYLGVRR
ncbi:hypothetical protein ACXVUM_12300 [Williamsia sp. SKLECPSW1]